MKLTDHPELLERLAAAWALGTLRGGARRRFETLARRDPAVRAAALLWRERLAGLVELQAARVPSPALWERIARRIAAEGQAAADGAAPAALAAGHAAPADRPEDRAQLSGMVAGRSSGPDGPGVALRQAQGERGVAGERKGAGQQGVADPGSRAGSDWRERLLRQLGWWRAGALTGALATVAAVGVGLHLGGELRRAEQAADVAQAESTAARGEAERLRQQLAAAPQVQYVAVLADERADASILVTFDPATRRLTLQRVGSYREADDRSLQLWALPPGSAPRSLGVLDADRVVRLPADEAQLREVPLLAISLEPKGGVPESTGPTGPVLFKGALLRTTL